MSDDVVRGWQAAAEVAGRSATSLRKLVEAKKLAARKDDDGVYVFERASLGALPPARVLATGQLSEHKAPDGQELALSPARDNADPLDGIGNVAALVFADLQAGRELRQIVVERKLAPETVRRTYEEWLALGEIDALRKPEAEARLAAAEASIAGLAEQLAAIKTGVREETGRGVQHRQATDGRLRALASQPRSTSVPPSVIQRLDVLEAQVRNLPAAPLPIGHRCPVCGAPLFVAASCSGCGAGRAAS